MQLSFVCVGPQRTATSWLDQVLRRHPGVALPADVKETFFLDQRFDRGWHWYQDRFFSDTTIDIQAGEVAPTCFSNPVVIDRLASHNPECKIIVNVRDPIERSISLYNHLYAKSRTNARFSEACNQHEFILDASRYQNHLNRWAEAFGPGQILLVPSTAVEQDPANAIARLTSFLGLTGEFALPPVARQRYGAKGAPRSRALARVMDRSAWWLRYAGFDRLVSFGKKIGVKKMVYSGGSDVAPELSAQELEFLSREFEAERTFVRQIEWAGVSTLAELDMRRG